MKFNIRLLMSVLDSLDALFVSRETKPQRLKDYINRRGHCLLGKATDIIRQ